MSLKLVKRGISSIWYVRGAINGRAYFKSTKTEDRDLARRVMRKIEEEALGLRDATFGDAVESYRQTGRESRFLDGLVKVLGGRRLTTLIQDDLDSAARKLYPKAAPSTLNRQVYTPFIAVFNRAVLNRQVPPWPWARPRTPKSTRFRPVAVRAGTNPVPYERAWQFVSAMSPAPAMVMTTLFYTGMRPIELFALQCEDVNVDGRWITVQASKIGEPRGIPMHEVLVPLLRALRDRGGKALFLTPKGGPYPLLENGGGQMKSAIKGARERLRSIGTPVDDVAPYTARHTVSTQLVVAGVHSHLKDQILGHAVDSMSRHYTNVPQAPLIEAIGRLPTIDAWANSDWLTDPLTWQGKVQRWENYGRRGKPVPPS
jgi:integrase/recombinase XerD